MKRTLTSLLAILFVATLFSQNDPRIAKVKTPLSEVDRVVLPKQDNEALLDEELNRRGPGVAPRFAVNIPVDISPENAGTWDYTATGHAVWRLRIFSEGAKSLNLGFTRYQMPEGGSLILYSPSGNEVQGPFTPADNEEHEQLWTPVLKGDEIVIEVKLPKENKDLLQLQLSYVNHDFLGFADLLSGSCNLDVLCGAADGWEIVDEYRDIIQSVAVIGLGGGTFCTGFLINNTRQDCAPLFMTAFHCGISQNNAPSLVAYWNFQNSTCRQPGSPQSGGPGDGLLNDFNTGAIFRAGYSPSDFTLVEFDDPVSETADAFFAGWDATDVSPGDSVICVHHPNTDEKRISFSFQETYISDYFGYSPNPNGDHVAVPDWDIGTTEGGSSGSPLFNNHKRVVGQLHGGGAACGNDDSDFYGWLHTSWEGGGTPSTRLKDWLDPDNTGTLFLDGRSQRQCAYFVEAVQDEQAVCAPADGQFLITVSENFADSVWLSISGLPDSLTATFSANPMLPGDTVVLTVGNTQALPEGQYEFDISGTDSTESNGSTLLLTIVQAPPAVPVLLEPADNAQGAATNPTFGWETQAFSNYHFQLASDSNFTNLIQDLDGLTTGTLTLQAGLISQETYFWRVQSSNACGSSDWSEIRRFTVAGIYCSSKIADDVPLTISSNGTPSVTSTIEINSGGFVEDINLIDLDIAHTWVGDLRVELTSPQGTTITLMANPDDGDCDSDDILVSFDDEATLPYPALDFMCNDDPPAIAGTFQPLQNLAAFNGEPIQGTWTLTVHDDADEDGGQLRGWGLEFCATIPDEVSVFSTQTEANTCVTDGLAVELILGTGFSESEPVNLTVTGLPPDATAGFMPNPAAPGAVVSMTISPTNEAGSYPLTITAIGGSDTASYTLVWEVTGSPAVSQLSFPPNAATGQQLAIPLQWQPADGADNYIVRLAGDSLMNDLILVQSTTGTSQTISNLDFCTTYYWQLEALGDCGASLSEVWSFTTMDDLTFSSDGESFTACTTDTLSSQVDVGSCFTSDGVTISVVGLPANADMTFSQNPVLPDGETTWTLTLEGVDPGQYTIHLLGDDGVHAVADSFTVEVLGIPVAGNLLSPAATEVLEGPEYTFTWEAGSGAATYTLQVATDEAFSNTVFEENLTGTTLTTSFPLHDHGQSFFWRVVFANACGTVVSPAVPFEVQYTATYELLNTRFELWPNPSSGLFFVKTDRPLETEVGISVSNALGQVLTKKTMAAGSTGTTLDLRELSPGLYFVSFTSPGAGAGSGNRQFTERLIIGNNN
ncbi:MAG: hypothetical protein Kow0027_15900 [Saprospiraceae bacterium]